MFPRAKSVRYVNGYDVEVTFTNGRKYVVPLGDEIVSRDGEMVRPLKQRAFFAKVAVNPEGGHLQWPNGYDIDPDVLYWLATGTPITFSSDPKYQQPPQHLQKQRQARRAHAVKK
jgi:hypothetical protein